MSNQVNPPGNEEAEVFVIVPAIANIEGCWKSLVGTGYLHALDQLFSMPLGIGFLDGNLHFGRVGKNCHDQTPFKLNETAVHY